MSLTRVWQFCRDGTRGGDELADLPAIASLRIKPGDVAVVEASIYRFSTFETVESHVNFRKYDRTKWLAQLYVNRIILVQSA